MIQIKIMPDNPIYYIVENLTPLIIISISILMTIGTYSNLTW
jgi:hypothetical protein